MDSSSDEGEKSFAQDPQGPAAFFFYRVCRKWHICSWLHPEGKVSCGIAVCICSVGQGSGISVKKALRQLFSVLYKV